MIIKQDCYDGSLIHKRFAYRFIRKNVVALGSIVAFRAPMAVTTNLIDLEDSLENDFIHSEDAVSFCWEIPLLDNAFGAVAFQRLFNTQIANILHTFIKQRIEVNGDDLIVHAPHEQGGVIQQQGKASVSITYTKDGVALGHTGINIRAGKKAPAFAYSTNLTDQQAVSFMETVCDTFYRLADDIFIATTKVQL